MRNYKFGKTALKECAGIAQLVERNLAKVESPVEPGFPLQISSRCLGGKSMPAPIGGRLLWLNRLTKRCFGAVAEW